MHELSAFQGIQNRESKPPLRRTYNQLNMQGDPRAVQISVDGSCYPNEGRKAGYAGTIVYPGDDTEHQAIFQGFEESTINRMELSACVAAMQWVREQALTQRGYARVQIFSDSQYVVNGQTSAPFWQRAKWRNSSGRPIENSDLWKDFLSAKAKAGIRVDICKVANKSTSLLKRVDKLAKAAAKSFPRKDRGLVVGKVGRAKIKGPSTLFPATNQVVVVHIVGSRTVGPTRENRFVVEIFDESTRMYLSKHVAYCTPEIGAQLHRRRGFRVQMNGDPKYPQMIQVLEEVSLPKAERKKIDKETGTA
jgi:ribonuclease HI